MANLKITLKKSLIGREKKQINTAYSLGLKRIDDITIQPDNPQTKGKINRIAHLLQVEQAN